MNKTLIAITLASALASNSAFAAETEGNYQSTQQDAGLGIGLLAGALVGGPIGFVVGGLIGSQAGQAEDYKQQLAEKDQQLAMLRSEIALAQARKIEAPAQPVHDQAQYLQHTTAASQPLPSTLATGMRIDVLFRTNSENIEPHYTTQLQRVIAVMKLFPELDVKLAGHADPRGPESDNLALSKRRVNSIHQTLMKAGIDKQRIHARAWGEGNTISTPKDIEAYAFDRRVVIDFVSKPTANDKAAMQQPVEQPTGHFLPASLQR